MEIKNKKISILIISIILLILLSTVILIPLNKSNSYIKNYSLTQALWEFKYNCGIPLQISASLLSYGGIAVSSLFDSDIKKDMDKIDWNPFNVSEIAVLNSNKVSFYKGVPVFRFNHNRSGSFLAIFLTNETNSRKNPKDVIRHEWGHNVQQLILGPANSFFCIFLPSWLQWSTRSYYDRPWEITADIFGRSYFKKT